MKLAFRTIIVAIGQLATSMERIIVVIILSRTLSTFDYGTYQQVWLFYLLVLPLFTLGLPGSILYFIPRAQPHRRKTVVFQTLFLLEIVGILFSLATLFTAPLVARQFNNPELVRYLRIFSIYPLLAVPPKLITLLMVAEEKPVHSAVISGLAMIKTIVFLTLPSIIGLPLVYTFYFANVGAFLFLIGTLAYVGRIYSGQRIQWDPALLRHQLAYSIPLGLASVLGVISKQLNKTVVSSTFSPKVYAVYVNGAFEIPFIGLLTGSLMAVLVPEFVKRLKQGETGTSVWSLWNTATTKTALLLFPIAVLLFVFASEFMVVMFSAKYVNSASIFQIYLALAVLRITQYGALLQALGRTRLILYTSIFGLLVNLGLSVVLIQVLGLSGPAWANVITTYIWAFSYLLIICRLLKISFWRVLPWKELARIILIAIASGLIVWPLVILPVGNLPKLLIGTVVYGGVYLAMLILTHTLPVTIVRSGVEKAILQFRIFLSKEAYR